MQKFQILVVLILLFDHAVSQERIAIDTVAIEALRSSSRPSESGRSISILTADDISRAPARSIDELLQRLPGLEIQSRGAFGVQADISLRGSTFNQMAILINGMKVNDPLTGHFNGYIPVSTSEIARIEIVRGPSASLYGANSVGGTINIVTKAFSHNEEGISGSGNFSYGSYNLVDASQNILYKKDKLTIGASFSMSQSNGELNPTIEIDTTASLEEYESFFDIKTVGISVAYDIDSSSVLRLSSSYDYRDFNARYFYTASTFDKSVEVVSNWWHHLQFVKIGKKSKTGVNLAMKRNQDIFVFSPDFPSTNEHETRILDFTVNHQRVISPSFSWNSGIQVDRRSITSNDRGDHEDYHFGVYTSGTLQLDKLFISGSLRGDYDENYNFELSPQINLAYHLPKIILRSSVGRSIRAADYTERYVSHKLMNLTPGRNIGNPNLLAESSFSRELGFDYYPHKNLSINSTLFTRNSSNLIDYILTNEEEINSANPIGDLQHGADYFFARNISEISTSGVELEAGWKYLLNQDNRLVLSLSYTYLNTTSEEEIVSVYLSSHAKHLLSTRFGLQLGRFDIRLTGLYKNRDAQFAPSIDAELKESYQTWNARLGYGFTENISLQLEVMNLFDENYQNILGAPMPSRWFMTGVTWNL